MDVCADAWKIPFFLQTPRVDKGPHLLRRQLMANIINGHGDTARIVEEGKDTFAEAVIAAWQPDANGFADPYVDLKTEKSGGRRVDHGMPEAIQKNSAKHFVPKTVVADVTKRQVLKMVYARLGEKHVFVLREKRELGENETTDNQTAYNVSMAKAEALKKEISHPTIPSDERLADQEASILATRPEPCSADLVEDACEKFSKAGGSATVAEVADLLLLTNESVQNFYEAANLTATSTCQQICEAAYTMLPPEVKPPKSWVGARRWRMGGRLYWDIDASVESIESMADDYDIEGELDQSRDDEPVPGQDNTSDSNNATISEDRRSSLGLIGTAGEIAEVFGLHPHMDKHTGSLLWENAEPPYTDDPGCVSGDCICYRKNSYWYNPRMFTTWFIARIWNELAFLQRFGIRAQIWAKKIFKVDYNDATLLDKLEQFYNQVRNNDYDVCIDFKVQEIVPSWSNTVAYCIGGDPKYYYTLMGWEGDTALRVLHWFHEVSHMRPFRTRDFARTWNAVKDLEASYSLKNADSYEMYVDRLMGNDLHWNNAR